MVKFIPKDDAERMAMLSLFIVTNKKVCYEMAQAVDDWILVGSMIMKHKGEWFYDFIHPMNVTMYSHTLGVRRQLTDEELNDLIIEEDETID